MIRELICYKCDCAKCGHSWVTKNHSLPKACPKCHVVLASWNSDYVPYDNNIVIERYGEYVTTVDSSVDTDFDMGA